MNSRKTQRKRLPPTTTGTSSIWSTVATFAATALVAYGAYQAVQWLYPRDDPDTPPPLHPYYNEETWDSVSARENGDDSHAVRNTAKNNTNEIEQNDEQDEQNDEQEHSARDKNTHTSMHKHQHQQHQKQTQPKTAVSISSLSQFQLQQQQEMVRVAFAALLPLLRRRLHAATNVAAERRQLKQLRQNGSSASASSSSTVHFVDTQSNAVAIDATAATAASTIDNGTALQQQQQQQQQALWMKIQVESLTKWLTAVYAYALLSALLTIQISIGKRHSGGVGGGANTPSATVPSTATTKHYTHSDPNPTDTDTTTSGMSSCHEALETTLSFFWQHGFPVLVARVRHAVATAAVRNWHAFATNTDTTSTTGSTTDTTTNTTTAIPSSSSSSITYSGTLDQFMAAMQQCMAHVDLSPLPLLTACFIPPTESLSHDAPATNTLSPVSLTNSSSSRTNDSLVQLLLSETWDLLESPVATDAVQQSLNAVLAYQRVHDWQPLFARQAAESCNVETCHTGAIDQLQSPLPLPSVPWPLVIAHTKPLVSAMLLDQNGSAASSSSLWTVLQSNVPALQEAARIGAAAAAREW
jgi:hypothetical protein